MIRCCVTAGIGVSVFGVAMIGWFKGKVNPVFRILLGVSTILLVMPSAITDIIGIAIIVIVFLALFFIRKKKPASVA